MSKNRENVEILGPCCKTHALLNVKTADQFLATRKLVEEITVEAGAYFFDELSQKSVQTNNKQSSQNLLL